MGSRIPERGRVTTLVEAFEEVVDEEKAERDAVRMLKGNFHLSDFSEQVQLLAKIRPLKETAGRISGAPKALTHGADIDEQRGRIVAMVSSMTADERRHPECFVVMSWETIVEGAEGKTQDDIAYDAAYDMRRLRRVAQGSGRKVHEVVGLLRRFAMMRHLMIKIGQSTGLFG